MVEQLQIHLTQHSNPIMTNPGGTTTNPFDKTLTYALGFIILMSGLNESFLMVYSEATKKNGDSLGHLKFNLCKCPRGKK